MQSTAVTLQTAGTAAGCPANQVACSECHCSSGGVAGVANNNAEELCPIASYTLTNGAIPAGGKGCFGDAAKDTVTVAGATTSQSCTWGNLDNTSWFLGMTSSMFGAPCIDPANNPAPSGTAATNSPTAIMNGDYDGCDQFGADPYMK